VSCAGRIVVIRGGSTEVGRASARQFARAGARVIVVDDDTASVREFRGEDPAEDLAPGSFSSYSAAQALVAVLAAKYGGIDFFLSCDTGEHPSGSILTCEPTGFDALVSNRVKGLFYALRHVLPTMVTRTAGVFIAITTTAAVKGYGGRAAQVATEHSVLGLLRGAALDVAARNVRVNAICRGLADLATDREPDVIADMTLFLCSEQARSITGAHFIVDGGESA
jgi:NAD(P)-dependent dehydrogenase (short-subunit alcohol dehydrogenase family)